MKGITVSPLQKQVRAEVMIPGSKSYTNRALLLAALTDNKVKILNPLLSDDTLAMIACLRTLGIGIIVHKNSVEVIGSVKDVKDGHHELDANLSGTTLRFILPLLTIVPGIKSLKGKNGLNKRPIRELVDALRKLGAVIEYVDQEGYPPINITSSALTPGNVTLSGTISSQYLSALLMIAPLVSHLTFAVEGTQVSKPYIDMTIDAMKKFGVSVRNEEYKKYSVPDIQMYKTEEYVVEGDFSSAGYFLAIAALTESTLTLKNINPDSVQADKKMLNVLEEMGNTITSGINEITIQGHGVKAIKVNAVDFPDQAQTLAVLAAFAKGTTKISGVQSLRIKETERIIALEKELNKMGIQTFSTIDTITIQGGNPKPALIDTHGDHRMAMAFAVAGTKLKGVEIRNPGVVKKTFPDFWIQLHKIGVGIKKGTTGKQKIVLIGFMGSGKSSIAPLLANKLRYKMLEMDALVLQGSKEKSIRDIFNNFGEKQFRELERKTAESLAHGQNTVISTGGGVVMNVKTMRSLAKNATIVYLSTQFETIEKRLVGNKDRPLWGDVQKARTLFELRTPLYEHFADRIISTDEKSVEQITDEITNILEVSV